MSYNWRKGGRRGPNDVRALPERVESTDGSRWACGRNVKGDRTRTDGGVTYSVVQVWTLKRRDAAGKVEVVSVGRDREAADRWVREGAL